MTVQSHFLSFISFVIKQTSTIERTKYMKTNKVPNEEKSLFRFFRLASRTKASSFNIQDEREHERIKINKK